MYLTGDVDIDIAGTSNSNSEKYLGALKQFNFKRIADKPTTITKNKAFLIDHIIVSHTDLIKFTDVLPCNSISDHDGPYAFSTSVCLATSEGLK